MKKIFILGIMAIGCVGTSVFCLQGLDNQRTKQRARSASEVGTTLEERIQQAIDLARTGRVDRNSLRELPECVSDACMYISDVVTRREQIENEASSILRVRFDYSIDDDLELLRACNAFFKQGVVKTYVKAPFYYLGEIRFANRSLRATRALLTLLLTYRSSTPKTLICNAYGIAVLNDLLRERELHQLGSIPKEVKVKVRVDDERPIQEEHFEVLHNCRCDFLYGKNTLGRHDIAFLKRAMTTNKLDNLLFSLESFRREEPDAKSLFGREFAEERFALSLFSGSDDTPIPYEHDTQLGCRLGVTRPSTIFGWDHWEDMIANFGRRDRGYSLHLPCDAHFTPEGITVIPPNASGEYSSRDPNTRFVGFDTDTATELAPAPIEWKRPSME